MNAYICVHVVIRQLLYQNQGYNIVHIVEISTFDLILTDWAIQWSSPFFIIDM